MRADVYLALYEHAESRQKAQVLIKNGWVSVDGVKLKKVSDEIDELIGHDIVIENKEKYVGRGGVKLEGALEEFCLDVHGLVCADIGASTGGFTDCLLQNGAAKVYAIDSGKGQLHSKLSADARVISIEGYNARNINKADVGEAVDMAVMDVSFISQTLIIPALADVIKDGGVLLSLIKPQFEAGRAAIGKNGIVKNKNDRYQAVVRVLDNAESAGFSCLGFLTSPIKGGDGNEEYLAYFAKNGSVSIARDIIKKTVTRPTKE